MNFANCVKAALKERERNISWLARRLDISEPRARQIATNAAANTNTIQRVADGFEMRPSELIALDEEKHKQKERK